MNQQITISTGSVEVENVNIVVPMAATYSNLQNYSNYAGPLEEGITKFNNSKREAISQNGCRQCQVARKIYLCDNSISM